MNLTRKDTRRAIGNRTQRQGDRVQKLQESDDPEIMVSWSVVMTEIEASGQGTAGLAVDRQER